VQGKVIKVVYRPAITLNCLAGCLCHRCFTPDGGATCLCEIGLGSECACVRCLREEVVEIWTSWLSGHFQDEADDTDSLIDDVVKRVKEPPQGALAEH